MNKRGHPKMHHEVAKKQRRLFFDRHNAVHDNTTAPVFYQKIIDHFNKNTSNHPRNIAFVVVAHLVHTLPFFIEAISKIGVIAAIIPKQSTYNREVVETINSLYADVIKNGTPEKTAKELLKTVDEESQRYLKTIFTNEPPFEGYQYIIIDHGGYFAPQMAFLNHQFRQTILGVVEHTWNGEERYKKVPSHTIPIFSIGHSTLKSYEDIPVAESIIDSMKGSVLAAAGLSQHIDGLHIGIVGFGHLGEAIGRLLKNRNHASTISVFDIDEGRQKKAAKLKCRVVNQFVELLKHSNLIFVATNSQAMKREHFTQLLDSTCVVCVTSSDDLLTPDSLVDYEIDPNGSNDIVEKYVSHHSITDKKTIYLAAKGRSVNFLIGSTAHPILHAVLAAVYVSAFRLIQQSNVAVARPENRIQSITQDDQTLILSTFKKLYPNRELGFTNEINIQQFIRINFSFFSMATGVFTLLGILIEQFLSMWRRSISTNELISRLKQTYQTSKISHMAIVPEYQEKTSVPIEHAFIRLTIIKEAEQREKENHYKNDAADSDVDDIMMHQFHSDEDLNVARAPIDLANIFTSDNGNHQLLKRLLILGRAGIGKSILCQYITHQWTSGQFWTQFKAVFWIKLRNLNTERYPSNPGNYSWIDVLNREHFGNSLSVEEKNFLQTEIEDNPSQFLFLLDGYDELTPEARNGYLEPAFSQLKNKEYSLITSRPQTVTDLQVDRRLEVMGFSGKDIKIYIQRFFNRTGEVNNTHTNALLDFLKRQPMIWAIAHIPLQLSMICQLEKDRPFNKEDDQQLTVSTLYRRSTKNMFYHYLIRTKQAGKTPSEDTLDALQDIYYPLQKSLEELAYHNMINDTIFFSKKMLLAAIHTAYPTANGAVRVGLCEKIIECGLLRPTYEKGEYYFIHLTFQEYFAAGAIARVLKNERQNSEHYQSIMKIILENRYNPRLQLMWRFVAGQLSTKPLALQQFYNGLMTEPRDLIGTYERNLLLHCLVESGESKELNLTRDQLLQPLLTALHVDNTDVIKATLRTLRNMGSLITPTTITTLLDLLTNGNDILKKATINALEKLGLHTSHAVRQALLNTSGNWEVRAAIATTLGNLDSDITQEVIQKLRTAVHDRHSYVNYCAVKALGKLYFFIISALPVEEDLPALIYEDLNTKPSIMKEVLKHSISQGTSDIGELLPMLQQGPFTKKLLTVQALKDLGSFATPAIVNELLTVLQDEQKDLKKAAAEALGQVGSIATRDVVDALLIALHDENEDVSNAATTSLGNFPSLMTNDDIQVLLDILRNKSSERRQAAAKALGAVGSFATGDVARAVVQELLRALQSKPLAIEYTKLKSIPFWVPNSKSEINPERFRILGELTSECHWSASEALGKLAATSMPGVRKKLLDALQNEDWGVKLGAVEALGYLATHSTLDAKTIETLVSMEQQITGDLLLTSYLKMAILETLGNLGFHATSSVIQVLLTATHMDLDATYTVDRGLQIIAEAMPFSVLSNVTLQTSNSAETIRYLSRLFAFRMIKQGSAFFYDKQTHDLCYWERGNLQRYHASPQELVLFAQEIRKNWQELTHLPIPNAHWDVSAELALMTQNQQKATMALLWKDECAELSAEENLTTQSTDVKKAIELCHSIFGATTLDLEVDKTSALCSQQAIASASNQMAEASFSNRFCLWFAGNNGLQNNATFEAILEQRQIS